MNGAGDAFMPDKSSDTVRARLPILLALVIVIGVALRLALPLLGHNFDVESYRIVADIMGDGGNVYAETSRYNYWPIWFLIVHWLDMLPGGGGEGMARNLTKLTSSRCPLGPQSLTIARFVRPIRS